jgi:hypothetical protein
VPAHRVAGLKKKYTLQPSSTPNVSLRVVEGDWPFDRGAGEPLAIAIWRQLIALTALRPSGWTLVGAQMVALHAYEHGKVPPRGTTDADVLVNVRAMQDATENFSRLLVDQHFQLDGVSPEGIGHRFGNGTVKIDVLAPDGLDRQRSRLTTVAPARTVSVPGVLADADR